MVLAWGEAEIMSSASVVETQPVADGPASAILQQVTNGLAVRMAVLFLLCGSGTIG